MSDLSRLQIVTEARRLADKIARLPPEEKVKRNTLYRLVSGFLQNPDLERLRQLLTNLPQLGRGILARGDGYAKQVQRLASVLLDELNHTTLSPADLAAVFGWTARMLPSDEDRTGTKAPKPPTYEKASPGPDQWRRTVNLPPAPPRPPQRRPVVPEEARVLSTDAEKVGGIGEENQNALAGMLARLEKKESPP